MFEFQVLSKGAYSRETLRVQYIGQQGRLPISDVVEADLREKWSQHESWTRERGFEPRNEVMLRYVDHEIDEESGTLTLLLGLTDYREFVCTRSVEFFAPRNRVELANPLGTSAVVVTSDNRILCGRRPLNANINPGRYFLVGGFMTPNDIKAGSSLFDGILREIEEETDIPTSSHLFTTCVGIVYDVVLPHPELCFTTAVREDFRTIQSYKPSDEEMMNLEYIDNDPEAIASWLMSLHPKQVVGTAEGCLLLHGLQAFGTAWFNNLSSSLAGKP